MLEWLQQADEEHWRTAILTQLLLAAGPVDNLNAAKWLRGQGAEWPWSFGVLQQIEPRQWSPFGLRTMQWALASGCPWGKWHSSVCIEMCSQDSTLSSQAAQDAVTWAHAAGVVMMVSSKSKD